VVAKDTHSIITPNNNHIILDKAVKHLYHPSYQHLCPWMTDMLTSEILSPVSIAQNAKAIIQ